MTRGVGRTVMTAAAVALFALAACGAARSPDGAGGAAAADPFPKPNRPVSTIVSPRWSTEAERDRLREAREVMDGAGVRPGMTVADIGAGEGYYTVRLAQRVGPHGRVLAEDIMPEVRDRLAERVARERLEAVSVRLGTADDPKLPPDSFDRIFLIHMYHEIASPYAFLWHLRPALRSGGRVVVVDADRQTGSHGTPPALLDCEFAAVGYVRVGRSAMPAAGGYMAMYAPRGDRPPPQTIKACTP